MQHWAAASKALLHQLVTPQGFLASVEKADNYKRIWARDSVVCGLAGLWIQDSLLIEAFRNSLVTLAKYQHELGMIPSNVDPETGGVSYGSLVGRIDTNTWFIVGACLYYKHTQDQTTWEKLQPAIEKCSNYLTSTEFNGKGWIYTPLSGNWADEYPVHGYTLYDNVLRLWGEKLYAEITHNDLSKVNQLLEKTYFNFWPLKDCAEKYRYQKPAFSEALEQSPQHFSAFIVPGKYDFRFDAAGNALALLLFDLTEEQKQNFSTYLSSLPNHLIPAFWPVMNEDSEDWFLLKGNYSYNFKNHPGHFHNGGIWPVWMGLLCYGLSRQGMTKEAQRISNSFLNMVTQKSNWDFQEYIDSNNFNLGGKNKMGYTASGILFMHLAGID